VIPGAAVPGAGSGPAPEASPDSAPAAAPASSAPEESAPSAPSSAAAPGAGRHVVRAGETLGGIARRYGVRVGDLAEANSISDPQLIHPGQELIIPNARHSSGSHRAASHRAAPAAPPEPETAPAAAPAAEPAAVPVAPAAVPAAPADNSSAGGVPVIKIDENPPPAAPANP
jgi:LysM repeat protein